MKNHNKTRQELLDELARLEQRVSDLEASEAECRRTTEKLQAKAQIMQVGLDSLPVLLSYIDSDHRYRFANRSYERQFGIPVDEIPGKHMREVMGETLYQRVRHYIASALSGEETSYEITTPRADGEPREMRVLFVPHFGRKQEVSGVAVLVTDVTERNISARRLEEAKDFSEKILRTSPVGIAAFNSEGQCVLVNEAAGSIIGATKEQVLAQNFRQIASWKSSGLLPVAEEVLSSGIEDRRNVHMHTTFGKEIWLDCRFSRFTSKEEPHLLIIIDDASESKQAEEELKKAHDELERRVVERTSELAAANERLREEIAERSHAEEALRTSEQRLELALKGADLGLWDWDVQTGQAIANERSAEIIGCSLEEIEQTFDFWASLLHPEDRPRVLEKVSSHLAGSADYYEDEYRVKTKSGEWKWVLSRGKVVEREDNGQAVRATGTYLDIDARKRSEQALAENEARYRTLFEHMKNGVAIYTAANDGKDFMFLDFNKAAEDISGIPRDGVIGKSVCNVFPGIKDLGLFNVLQKTWRTGTPSHLPVGRYKDERIEIWVENSVYKLPSGEIVAVFNDETQRKRAEEALKGSEQRFRLLYQEAPVSYQSLDEDGHLLEVNKTWLDLLGYSRDEVIGKWFGEFLAPRWQAHFTEGFPKFKAGGEVRGLQVEMLKKDGSEISVSFDGKIAGNEDGTFKQTHCVLQDITDKKLAEEALRKSEAKYRAIFNNAAIGIDLVDAQGRFGEANPAFAKMLGYAQEELENLTVLDVTHPDDSQNSTENLDCLVQGDCDTYRLEKRYLRKDGSEFWADICVSAIRGPSGEYEATIGVIRDISERKRFEVAQRRLATAIEQAGEAIVITDAQGLIEYVNPAFEHVTGYTRQEVAGSSTRMFKSGEHDESFYKKLWNTVRGGQVWKGRFINRKKDGSIYHEDATISPVRDSEGKIVNFVAVKRDMTEHLELSKQLLQAQKMEAIGTLAGGIAHDFNNILQITLGFSEMLLADKDETDEEYADLQKIAKAAQNGADLVQRLLTFSRKVEPNPRPIRLNQQIRQLEKLLGRTIPKMISIKLSLDEDLCTVNADPTQMEQIIMNLAVNARDAMPEGGELLVRTQNVALDEDFCRAHPEARPGKYAMVEIADTGQGMDNETLQHIFEPFYTTKELGRGTGLGLAMVYGIVNQHAGLIECESEQGSGTRFRIYLPAIPKVETAEGEPAGIAPALGTETILLVDDEELVRDLGRRILTRWGYTVLTATNGKEALRLFGRSERKIDLVILDLIMPEMGGKQCLQELMKMDPHVRVLIASGYSSDGPLSDTVGGGARGFVSKPFRINDLLRVVREALDSE